MLQDNYISRKEIHFCVEYDQDIENRCKIDEVMAVQNDAPVFGWFRVGHLVIYIFDSIFFRKVDFSL